MKFRKLLETYTRHLSVWGLLVAPIVIYVRTFGSELSDSHQRWAEMGSAMSGIYGPMLALLGFGVLTYQSMLQQQTTKHMFDQTSIQASNSDVDFYLAKLETSCAKFDQNGVTIGQRLDDEFGFLSGTGLRDPAATTSARRFHEQHPQVFAAWMAYQSVVAGLQSVDETPYRASFSSARQKANVALSLAVCRALDHGVWCWSEGRLSGPYLFGQIPT
jgi:hypothetical protein